METIRFAAPHITPLEINAVTQCLESGWLTSGRKVTEFEQAIEAFVNDSNELNEKVSAVAVNSATSGLVLALKALGVGMGDEVITTPYTFTATAEAIERVGAMPVFVDIEQNGYNIDIKRIPGAITERTKAIIPVHFGGVPCNMHRILEIARDRNLFVVEDAAHAFGSSYQGKPIGSLDSDATVFSFYATKPICTGEGGAVLSKYEKIMKSCRLARQHGIDKSTHTRHGTHYDVVMQGEKCNMPDPNAAMGIVQIERNKAMRDRRKFIATQYFNALCGLLPEASMPQMRCSDEVSWHLFPISLDDQYRRGWFLSEMAEQGIQCGVHYIPVHLHSYWAKKYGFRPTDFPNAFHAYLKEVSLPIHAGMSDDDIQRVANAAQTLLKPKAF